MVKKDTKSASKEPKKFVVKANGKKVSAEKPDVKKPAKVTEPKISKSKATPTKEKKSPTKPVKPIKEPKPAKIAKPVKKFEEVKEEKKVKATEKPEEKKVEKSSTIAGRLPGQKQPTPEEGDGTRVFY
jgi:hypothetical protein